MTPEQSMLHMYEQQYPQAPITMQRALVYGAWMMDHGRGHIGLKTLANSGFVEVMDLWVAPNRRGDGVGRRIMAQVCEDADILGNVLKLRIHAYHRRSNGLTNPQLTRFYRTFGFAPDTAMLGYYRRQPKV